VKKLQKTPISNYPLSHPLIRPCPSCSHPFPLSVFATLRWALAQFGLRGLRERASRIRLHAVVFTGRLLARVLGGFGFHLALGLSLRRTFSGFADLGVALVFDWRGLTALGLLLGIRRRRHGGFVSKS
jgi:hypothetical protein